ncbi:MAG: energy transducer TonB [Candidatus Omnitrophica bacterium]|nr:energy transducer TonB [Candidatus Omnitrophota bacterium]
MDNRRIMAAAFMFSMAAHAIAGAAIGNFFDGSFDKKAVFPRTEIILIKEKEIPALLPDIDMIGKEKKLGQSAKEEKPKETKQEQFQDVYGRINLPAEEKTEHKQDVAAKEAMLRYQDKVKQRIEARRRYPAQARQKKIEGTVNISFSIMRDGSSQEARVAQSSGCDILDKEAVDTIKRACPFLPLPEEITSDSIAIYVAIVFALN